MISLSHLRKRYSGADADAVADLSLDIPAGQVFGLLGPNGAGKSTLIGMLCGVISPSAGEIKVGERRADNQLIKGRTQACLGVVPQALAFYPSLTVAENLEFYAAATPGSNPERMASAINSAQLAAHMGQRASRLSGGLKRRLNLAIGLLGSAQILLMDEPTVGVDAQSRLFLLDTVRTLAGQGCTLILTSHYLDEIEQVCDRVGILDYGNLLLDASLKDIRSNFGGLEAAYLKLTHRALRE